MILARYNYALSMGCDGFLLIYPARLYYDCVQKA